MQIKNTVACLKYGDKYQSDYVNNLYSMFRRHCSYEHEFVCFTDDANGLNENIKTIPLKTYDDIHGWWYKTFLFDPSYSLSGSILFLDLDVVIFNGMDKFFEFSPNDFCISRGFRKDNKRGMNSSCFRFESGTHSYIYENFMKDRSSIMKRLHGDQDWIQEQVKDYSFWPETWLLSYKWDMVQSNGDLKYTDDTSIAVFHGKPNPHELDTNWVKDNWR
jgi:hypothetical protein